MKHKRIVAVYVVLSLQYECVITAYLVPSISAMTLTPLILPSRPVQALQVTFSYCSLLSVHCQAHYMLHSNVVCIV